MKYGMISIALGFGIACAGDKEIIQKAGATQNKEWTFVEKKECYDDGSFLIVRKYETSGDPVFKGRIGKIVDGKCIMATFEGNWARDAFTQLLESKK